MSESYALATGEKAVERLELQANFGLKWSLTHLKEAGIKEGMTVIDMGCGVGAMTTHLAKLVGKNGKVYAVDESCKQLNIAKAKIKNDGITNVEFIKSDIYVLQERLIGEADIIYMRFVLTHLTKPEEAVRIIKNYLKPAGVIASQETILNSFDALSDYVKVGEAMAKHKGVNYNLGESTKSIFQEAGFNKVEVEYKQLKLDHQTFKEFMLLSINEWKDKAIEAKVLDLDKVNQWKKELNNLSTELEYSLAKSGYVLAWN